MLHVSLEFLLRKVIRILKIHTKLLIKPDLPFVVKVIDDLISPHFLAAWTRADEETVLAGIWFVSPLANRYDKDICHPLEDDAYWRVAFACDVLNLRSESLVILTPFTMLSSDTPRNIRPPDELAKATISFASESDTNSSNSIK